MKKGISLLIILATCLSVLMTFTSCSKHPIEEFKEKMEKADSYQMSITMSDVPLLGTFTMTTKVDGNIQYIPAAIFEGESESYIETVGDVSYKYTKDAFGKWTKVKEETNDDSNFYDDESMEKIFNPDNYEKVKGEKNAYKQKAGVTFEDIEDVKITIAEDSCTIEMKVTAEGMTFGATIVISHIGEVKLSLPQIG